ncbi:MAG: hypothetical protein EXR48_02320 [Dehalococcoidia bacterium]|nr:hypothetical protein [Dehalococcoidia bacterium]
MNSVRLERDGPLAWLTLARPRAGNGVDQQLAQELGEACRAVRRDNAVRVLLVTGAGKTFSAGAFPPPEIEEGFRTPVELLERVRCLKAAAALAAVEKPVVAVINGPAAGQGLELALACDLRLASTTATFALPHLQHGLLPWDGGVQRLVRVVGRSWATELLLTGRSVPARQALALGLVHRVVPHHTLMRSAKELGERIAAGAPIAARYAKEALLKGADMPLEEALRLETDLAILLHSTYDRAEGLLSFAQRRAPRFEGR